MTMLVAWVVFPAVFGALSLGCGLLLERAAGIRLSGPLLLPAGFAVIVVAASLATMRDGTAELATPLVVSLAVAGYGLSLPLRGDRFDVWCVGGAVAVFAVFAAPVVASGDPTFAGYIKLDDTSTWLAFTDHVMEHGRSLAGLAPSTYEATLASNLPGGYPLGAHLPLGIGHELTGEDSAWLFQPQLAFLAALLALAGYELVRPLIRSRPLRVVTVVVGSQAALFYGYALWGGVKELSTAPIVALLAGLVPAFVRGKGGVRSVLPLASASAATLAILSLAGGIWLLPVLAAAILAFPALPRSRFLALAGAFAVAATVLAIPALSEGDTFIAQNVEHAGSGLRAEADLGNLIEPLNPLQLFGIWPTGDFRYEPGELALTYILIAVVVAAGLAGLALALRARHYGLPVYVLGSAAAAVATALVASPWVDAKAFAMASPAIVFAALSGVAILFEQGRRVEAVLAGAAIVGGVAWSNLLAYHEVWLAPYDKLAELEVIGERVGTQGPTLMTEYEPYGVRHFLREADPEGASELRRRPVPLRDGSILDKAAFADIDQFDLAGLLEYRTLVLRRSPLASRPPSAFRIVWEGRHYEIWQRIDAAPPIIEHVALGEGVGPSAIPRCADVLRLAARAGPDGKLAAVLRSRPVVVDLGSGGPIFLDGSLVIAQTVDLPVEGMYGAWIGSEFRGRLGLAVDEHAIGEARHELKPGQFTLIDERPLPAGRHAVRIDYGGPDLRPGSGGRPWFGLGPLVFSRSTAERPVLYVPPRNARSLCGRSLDWVEAIGAS
jgi:hypothetical protein